MERGSKPLKGAKTGTTPSPARKKEPPKDRGERSGGKIRKDTEKRDRDIKFPPPHQKVKIGETRNLEKRRATDANRDQREELNVPCKPNPKTVWKNGRKRTDGNRTLQQTHEFCPPTLKPGRERQI